MQYYFEATSPGSTLPWEVTVTVFKHLSKTSHQQINQISLMDKKQHLAFHPWLVSAGLICKCDKHVFKLSLKFMALQHRPWSKAAAVPKKATQQRKLSSAKANCSQILIWTQTSIILNETFIQGFEFDNCSNCHRFTFRCFSYEDLSCLSAFHRARITTVWWLFAILNATVS